MKDSDLLDMFIDWLDKPFIEYGQEEIIILWNEFMEIVNHEHASNNTIDN